VHRSDADADRRDWQGLIGRGSSSSTASVLRQRQQHRLQQLSAATDSEDDDASSSSEQDASTSLPELDAQRLRQRHLKATWSLLAEEHFRKTRAAAAAEAAAESAASVPSPATADADADSPEEADEAEESVADAAPGGGSSSVVGRRVREQLASLFAPADSDSWGTTQQSPADIARRIADSNRAAAGGGGDNEGESVRQRVLQLLVVLRVSLWPWPRPASHLAPCVGVLSLPPTNKHTPHAALATPPPTNRQGRQWR
jgi:hypothetical protein